MTGPTEIERLNEENKRLAQELKQRNFELSILYDISHSISYTLNYDDLIYRIMDSLHQIVDYDLCSSLIVSEDEKPRMVIRLANPMHRELIEKAKTKAISALNSLRGSPLLEQDISVDLKGKILEDKNPRERIKSSFDVPLFVWI